MNRVVSSVTVRLLLVNMLSFDLARDLTRDLIDLPLVALRRAQTTPSNSIKQSAPVTQSPRRRLIRFI